MVLPIEDLELASKWWESADHPTLFAWTVESFTPAESWTLVRNPYYWKVDTAGNQLPYIDRVDVALVEDEEVRTLSVSQGKYDASFRGVADPRNIPLLAEQAESNDFQLLTGWMNWCAGAGPAGSSIKIM